MKTTASTGGPSAVRSWQSSLRWFAAEITVVVAGVLIALALNAWWVRAQEEKAAATLMAELSRDITATRAVIARSLQNQRDLAADARRVLKAMTVPTSIASRDSALSRIGSIFVLSTFDPVNDTYAEALGSGRLNLINDPELRLAVSRYQSKLAAIQTFADLIARQYYGELEPFMVANTIYSEIAYDQRRAGLVPGSFRTDFAALARNRELWNLITLRLEWVLTLEQYLTDLDERAREALNGLTGARAD